MKPVLMLLAGLFASAVRLRAVKAVSGALSLLRRRTKQSATPSRHPYQIHDLADLELGKMYAFVHTRKCDGRTFVYPRRFVGAFSRPPTERELATVKSNGCDTFTIHHDGWAPHDGFDKRVRLWLWRGGRTCSYCGPDYALGRNSAQDQHEVLVPLDRWDESPRIAADWGEVVHRPEKGDKKVWVYHLLWGRIAGRVEEATRSGKVHYVTFR